MVERSESEKHIEEHKLGEWFSPIRGYEDLPIEGNLDYYNKSFEFNLEGFQYPMKAITFCGDAGGKDQLAVVLTPTATIPFNESQIGEMEKKILARLISIDFYIEGRDELAVELRMDSEGSIYRNEFEYMEDFETEHVTTDWNTWVDEEGNQICLYFPEREYILERIQVKFERL